MAKKTKPQLSRTAQVTLKDGTTDTCRVYGTGGKPPWLERVGKSGIEKKQVFSGRRLEDLAIDIAGWYQVPNESVKFK